MYLNISDQWNRTRSIQQSTAKASNVHHDDNEYSIVNRQRLCKCYVLLDWVIFVIAAKNQMVTIAYNYIKHKTLHGSIDNNEYKTCMDRQTAITILPPPL